MSRAGISTLAIGVLLAAAGGVGAQPSEPLRERQTSSPSRVHLAVSLADRVLTVLQGPDTIARMPIGVASGRTFVYGGRTWRFRTPPGEWRVVQKVIAPVWTPPDWHYAETAYNHGLRLTRLPAGGITLSTGSRLVVRYNVVGIVYPGANFAELPVDEHIVFDGRLFIPPRGTVNRQVPGHLGRYALDLGQGYMIHGTANEASIGQASTHGCIRVRDDDIRWLFENVPVGARVVIR